MNSVYNGYFFNEFFENKNGETYKEREIWMPFFSNIADNIIKMFNPKTVLDAGCAMGYLVAALRERGVEAYGFDISEYAVENADEAAKPYLAVHSITDPLPESFPQHFDVITTIEVVEHLFPEGSSMAIKNLCSYSDVIIFSSTPEDIDNRTHYNVRLPEYWCREFALNSFYHDLLLPADFICPHAMIFRRREKFEDIVFDYELNKRIDKTAFERQLTEYKGKLYFDTGSGYSEENSVEISFDAKKLCNIKERLPLNCKNVKFKPAENTFSAVKYFGTSTDMGLENAFLHNGKDIGGITVFDTKDPYILINLPDNSSEINICVIVFTFDSTDLLREFVSIYNMICDADAENKRVNELCLNLSAETERLRDNLQKAEENIYELEKTNSENAALISGLNGSIAKLQYEHNEVLSSECWKMTKPLRIALQFFRSGRSLADKKNFIKKVLGKTYSIDKSTYTDGIYNLSGWIFDAGENIIDITLNINAGGESCEISEGNLYIWRPDVFNAYEIENAKNCGFEFSVLVNTDKPFDVSLNYRKGSKTGKIKCGSFKGEKTVGSEDRIISVIKSGVPVDIEYMISKYIADKPQDYSNVYKKSYDIIVPVYNGFKYLDRLFETIAKTKADYRLIIIEDCSTDERVRPYLESIKNKYGSMELIIHDNNVGFAASVNEGLGVSENDAVILNTDVELPEMWLERLAAPIADDPLTASAAPFTNSGTICSFPDFLKDNTIFMGKTVDEIDRFFGMIKPSYVSAPTVVGFCMAVSRAALNKTGLFDAETFGKGYCEENDWCQRAIKNGFKNVIVENLFVFHNHGGSFMPDEKKMLLEKNHTRLIQKHPNYEKDIASYCENNPHKRLRDIMQTFLGAAYSKRVNIIFSHSWGGGAESYVNELKYKLTAAGEFIAEIIYRTDIKLCCMEVSFGNFKALYSLDNLDFFMNTNIKIDKIIINELVGYPDIYGTLNKIADMQSRHNAELIYLMHDYFSICPSMYLLRDNKSFCHGETDCSKCDSCLKTGKAAIYPEYESTAKWREKWTDFLGRCSEVRFFSEASKNIAASVYGELPNYTVVPHKLNYMPNINKKHKFTKTLNIGILGDLTMHKGLNIVSDMLNIIKPHDNMKIKLIGSSGEKVNNPNYSETGKYTYDELPVLTLENDIDVFFIASVWPETFSYTAEEAMKMGMPVMSFDIGAHADRIKNYENGYVLNDFSAKAAIETAESIELKPLSEPKRVLFVSDAVSYCSRYRAEHFMEQLLTEGVPSDFILSSETKSVNIHKYTSVVIHRSIYTNKLKQFIDSVHRAGKKVFFDVDDLIFNYGRISYLDFLREEGFEHFRKHTEEIAACMEICDGYLTSTNCLADEIADTFPGRPVCINRNVLSLEMLTISNRARESRREYDGRVILGYFSGSKTHDKDFELIADILVYILDKYENAYLALGGFVEIDSRFDKFKTRIIRFEFCSWKKLPYVISSVDINLMPLEQSIFHECKSENKWTEAAAVGVCTVGSYNNELARIIKNGVNGYLCSDANEWTEALSKLIENRELRESIADKAVEDVLQNHTVLTAGKDACRFVLE